MVAKSHNRFVLAVDLGTSGCKCALVRLDGTVDQWAFRSFPLHIVDEIGAEQDPEDWWSAFIGAARELIATRKARPRLAEGPLREAETAPDGSQLRIFEVEPEAISKEVAVNPVLPEWHSIRLDAKPREEFHEPEEAVRKAYNPLFELPLRIAPMEDRLPMPKTG